MGDIVEVRLRHDESLDGICRRKDYVLGAGVFIGKHNVGDLLVGSIRFRRVIVDGLNLDCLAKRVSIPSFSKAGLALAKFGDKRSWREPIGRWRRVQRAKTGGLPGLWRTV